jgi:hypothetical protein
VVVVVSEASDVVEALPGQPAERGVLALPHRDLVHDHVTALAVLGLPVADALLVRGGRWWSYDCPMTCCGPDGGAPLPEVGELAAASIAGGVVVEPDRAALAGRIAPLGTGAMAAMAAETERAGIRLTRASPADRARAAARSWQAVRGAVRRCRPGGASAARPLPDRDVARVLWALADVRVRDRALGLALGPDAAAAEVLWTECTRRAPTPLGAAPATLLAVSAWLRGDGAMANVALERALAHRPDYSLADLLAQGLAACLPPADLRVMIGAAVATLDEDEPR